ncbi:hypothetical protein KBC59_00730 [Patescibacteria group bacterium]|nr:hypothetical protein [Patescibacteria group bacterium]
MAEPKPKAPSRRPKKAASSPIPEGPMGGMTSGPACGHGDCGRECAVRYVGPTSHMRDHHIVHAARGAAHVWTAAIVSGLAIVLTGAIAWSSVEAQTTGGTANTNATVLTEIRNLGKRVERLETLLKTMNDKCVAQAKDCRGATAPTDPVAICIESCKKEPATNAAGAEACAKKCREASVFPAPGTAAVACTTCDARNAECQKTAGTDEVKLASCKTAYETCSTSCKK